MQDVDNNMDSLFQKAAAGYNIQQAADNWDKILPQLSDPVVIPKPGKGFKKYFPFIVLSIIIMGSSILIFDGDIANKQNHISLYKKDSQRNENIINDKIKNTITANSNNKNITIKSNANTTDFSASTTNENKNGTNFTENNDELLQTISVKKNVSDDIVFSKHSSSLNNIISPTSLQNKKIDFNITVNPASAQQQSIQRQHKLYAGFVTGIGFAEIKSQGFQRPGFSIGGLAEYRFTDKFSVETGVLLSGKYYSTDVRYFNMDKIESSMPSGMEVLHIDGNSTVWDFPLNIHYTFISKKKNEVYVSAGTSSYLLTKEENKYSASMNGTQQDLNRSYTDASFNFAATINTGIGYQYRNKFNNTLRIEPYIQIPVKGMGVGSLPVMTVGIQAGFMFK